MFSSLASFIFGSNTSATTNSEANHQPIGQRREPNVFTNDENLVRLDAENTINVTSSTPSVTGCHNESISISGDQGSSRTNQGGKRNRAKRNKPNRNTSNNNNNNHNNKRQQKTTPTLAKLLTPNESCDEDLDEDEWFIVEKEDEDDSLPRTDSEEELSVVDVKGNTVASTVRPLTTNAAVQSERQRQQHIINSHSLYSGPRPQQQRNLLQRARNNARTHGAVSLNVSILNPPRNIIDAGTNAGIGAAGSAAAADIDCVTQSLYVARPAHVSPQSSSSNDAGGNSNIGMEESWFVTPPPCFTSLGPINMETSPYENLLIEHPSMSVYHSIRSAQEAAESFVNLDLGVGESPQIQRPTAAAAVSATVAVEAANTGRNVQATTTTQQSRAASARADRFSAAQLKQELFARTTQKCQDKKERQNLCRGAIKRANKVRDFQSKANRQRRSDMQHCKILSGANNNRKCCF